jgi:hypothetical protein
MDYSFFALLFYLASSLAPNASAERTWVNGTHPEQSITWTPEGEGWEMTVNGREIGVFQRDGDAIVHHTGVDAPHRFPIAELASVAANARRIPLRGSFAPTVLTVEREQGRVSLVDPTRNLLRTRLILRAR